MNRIGVVDRDSDYLALINEVLMEEGWHVVLCPNEETAVACLQAHHPDVVLLDLWLTAPDSGWQVLQDLHENPLTCDIPVIVCSADTVALRTHAAWLAQHRIAVVEKPFDLTVLEGAVQEMLRTRPQEVAC